MHLILYSTQASKNTQVIVQIMMHAPTWNLRLPEQCVARHA